jgi:RNA polymerase sigma-70 factor (ECF subfamily)
MNARQRRSVGVNETLAVAIPTQAARTRLDFEALYRSSRDDVFAYVVGMLRDRATAEDVTAAAFERAYRKRRSFDGRRGEPRAWLFGIARNAALDELRRRRRVATLRRSVLQAGISSLAPRDRELVALKFFAGLSNAEIASVLGVTPSNAGTMLHRAVQKLRKACHATP